MAQIIANNNGGGGGGGGGSYTPGNGIDITGSSISIDEDVVQTKDNLVTNLDDADNDHYPSALAVKNAISSGGGGDVSGPSSSVDGDIAVFNGNTGKIIKDGGKKLSDFQEKLTAQTAYTSKGTATKVAQITTNTLGQVTNVTEVDIDYPSQVDNTAYGSSWDGVTGTAPSKNAVYDKINSIDTEISTINGKIPSEASSSNKLADKDYVNDSINSVTAYYITKNAAGDQFATKAELDAATTFYSGGVVRTPTRNDYTIVLDDETHNDEVTRYIYNNGWEYQYSINESPMTQAQINALNSGITSGKVSTYDGYAATIAGKQNALTTQTAYTNKGTSTKVAQISTNTLGQVTNVTEQDIAFPVTSVNNKTGQVTVNEVPSGGADGQVLTKVSGDAAWANPSGISMLSGSPNTIAYEWVGTQAQYEALGTYRSDTRYTII